MCKTSLAKSKPCGFLKPPSTFHKHVSSLLRMKWPIVSVAVRIQVHSAFLQSVTDLHHELKIEWIKTPKVLVPGSQILISMICLLIFV